MILIFLLNYNNILELDNENSIIIGGEYFNPVTLYNKDRSSSITLPNKTISRRNGFLVKYSDTGYVKWATYIDGESDSVIYSVTISETPGK